MIYRHINRGNVREGGCPLCKPIFSRRANWYRGYGSHPFDHYQQEEAAEDFDHNHNDQEKGEPTWELRN